MKEKMSPFSFSRGEISAHRVISNHRNISVRDLSISMHKAESSVSQIVKRLESKGIVESERKGMKKIVNTSDRNYAITFSEMIKNEPNTPWEKILSN
ncbi:MAG: MarR family transcriptional regulator, partial [Candidatus Thermoplasmatota archaeon]|nr:MarR family transcriptional regulator [Candidatus Thermoplasmatota archaeon]